MVSLRTSWINPRHWKLKTGILNSCWTNILSNWDWWEIMHTFLLNTWKSPSSFCDSLKIASHITKSLKHWSSNALGKYSELRKWKWWKRNWRWREVGDSSQSFSSDTHQGTSSEWSRGTTELVYKQESKILISWKSSQIGKGLGDRKRRVLIGWNQWRTQKIFMGGVHSVA